MSKITVFVEGDPEGFTLDTAGKESMTATHFLIGRPTESYCPSIAVPDRKVSRRQAMIRCVTVGDVPVWQITNLSDNQTFVRRPKGLSFVPSGDWMTLRDEEQIVVGNTTIELSQRKDETLDRSFKTITPKPEENHKPEPLVIRVLLIIYNGFPGVPGWIQWFTLAAIVIVFIIFK